MTTTDHSRIEGTKSSHRNRHLLTYLCEKWSQFISLLEGSHLDEKLLYDLGVDPLDLRKALQNLEQYAPPDPGSGSA